MLHSDHRQNFKSQVMGDKWESGRHGLHFSILRAVGLWTSSTELASWPSTQIVNKCLVYLQGQGMKLFWRRNMLQDFENAWKLYTSLPEMPVCVPDRGRAVDSHADCSGVCLGDTRGAGARRHTLPWTDTVGSGRISRGGENGLRWYIITPPGTGRMDWFMG
ncbi:hypothetical protein SRHO_G00095080 [Serrasalmus rhombeus]